MMLCNQASVIALVSVLFSACGGSGSSVPLNDALPPGQSSNALCQNTYYRTIIGRYEGTAVFKVRAQDGSETVACTWTIAMDIRHEGSPVVCDLIAEFDASVEQTIVLDASDPDAFQCFPETSLRQVNDLNTMLDPAEFENITYPLSLRVFEDPSLSTIGPYFGDENVVARHHRLLDFGWVKRFIFDGDGVIDLRTSFDVAFPFVGHLRKTE